MELKLRHTNRAIAGRYSNFEVTLFIVRR